MVPEIAELGQYSFFKKILQDVMFSDVLGKGYHLILIAEKNDRHIGQNSHCYILPWTGPKRKT